MSYAIDLKNVSKKYKLYQNSKQRLLDLLLPFDYGEDFYALRGIDFQANKGETIGFIGINGSGKSTLLNIIAGVVPESSGDVNINGEASLIAVSSGLKGNLTGRENIRLKCLMLGFSEQEIDNMEEDIVEFSELHQFIDQPVKSYSSGMKSRLGFAISVNINPDILIIDEALSVGDKSFAQKCLNKIDSFKESGKTILFVSHNNPQIKQFCDKVLWLEFGKVRAYGDVDAVMEEYEQFLQKHQKMTKEEKIAYRNEKTKNS